MSRARLSQRRAEALFLSTVGIFIAPALVGCDRDDEKPHDVGVRSSQVAQSAASTESTRAPSAAPAAEDERTKATGGSSVYDVPERSQEQIDQGLRAACESAQAQQQPLLIEFSAPWCGDCRRLAEMKKEPELAQKLRKIPYFAVNIGRFDRHEGILDDFSIRAIANWQIVDTADCRSPVGTWKRLEGRTLEPATGSSKVTAQDLSNWLEEHFERG